MIRFPLPRPRQFEDRQRGRRRPAAGQRRHRPASNAARGHRDGGRDPGGPGPPRVDEIVSSPNLRQVANLPKQAPFDTTSALNTDMAFQGRYAFVGNYNGFVIYDIGRPSAPKIVSQVLCPGSQNDISVYGDLLFLSTDSSRSDDSCNSVAQPATVKESWEGIKVFDISDKADPRYIKSVETACGSHTHTLVPGKDRKTVYLYVSSYSPRAPTFPDCQPPHDSISIVKVPVKKPDRRRRWWPPRTSSRTAATRAARRQTSATTGCHDITAYPEKDLAAGACMGDGVLLDIPTGRRPG